MIIRRRARMPRNVAKFKPVEPLQRHTDYPERRLLCCAHRNMICGPHLTRLGTLSGFLLVCRGSGLYILTTSRRERERERSLEETSPRLRIPPGSTPPPFSSSSAVARDECLAQGLSPPPRSNGDARELAEGLRRAQGYNHRQPRQGQQRVQGPISSFISQS